MVAELEREITAMAKLADVITGAILVLLTWNGVENLLSVIVSAAIFVYFTSRLYWVYVEPKFEGKWGRFFKAWFRMMSGKKKDE